MRRSIILLIPSLLLLTGCNLAGDVTPPPGLSIPTEVQATLTPTDQRPAVDTESSESVQLSPPGEVADLVNGEGIYTEKCAPCHGLQGMGNGPMAENLEVPIPAIGDKGIARAAIPMEWYEIVTTGRMENFMPPFPSLSDKERWDVTAYALTLSILDEELSQGEGIYTESCLECHGEDGVGSGIGVDLSDPSNAALHSSMNLYDVISNGQNSMPQFVNRLTNDEIWAVTAYTRSLSTTSKDGPVVDETEESSVPGTITGTVYNGTSGAESPIGIEVLLVGFDGDQPAMTETALLDNDGSFIFDELELVPGRLFGVIVEYDGVRYFSSAAHFLEDDTAVDLPIVVHESTDEVGGLFVERLHLIHDFSVEGLMDVAQIWLVTNQGDRTFISDGAALTIQLPEGFENLQASDTSELAQLATTSEGVDVIGPLRAGETSELAITFSLPYKRSATLSQEIPLPVSGVTMITAEDGPQFRAEGLIDRGLRDMGGSVFQSYELDSLTAGENLVVKISGAHPAAASIETSTLLIVGVGILGVAMIGAGIYLWRTQGRDEDVEDVVNERSDTDATRSELIQAIAALDDAFEAGEISEDEYESKRTELKQVLKEILSGDD